MYLSFFYIIIENYYYISTVPYKQNVIPSVINEAIKSYVLFYKKSVE